MEQENFEIRHAPEVVIDVDKLGGAQGAQLKSNPQVFPFLSENEEGFGENFEVNISDSEFCSQLGFLRHRITGIVYPRYYSYLSTQAALGFAAARVAGNQRSRGRADLASVAQLVERETIRISELLPKEADKLLLVDVGQNEDTQVYFYARGKEGTATVHCIVDDFYKRCSGYGNLEGLGFAVSIHKAILKRPNALSCYFRAFEIVAQQAAVN